VIFPTILSAAGVHLNADLLVGLAIGASVGFLAGPVIRARITYHEWQEASRQARLTDEFLARLDGEDPDDLQEHGSGSDPWRTSR
jgi:hypothetical protein